MLTCSIVSVNVTRFKSFVESSAVLSDNVTLSYPINFTGPVRLLYIQSSDAPQYVIAKGSRVESNYTAKITTSVDGTSQEYNMTIYNVLLDDAGWYVYIEDSDSAFAHPVFLSVHG